MELEAQGGYEPDETLYHLVFEDRPALEVMCREPSVGQLLTLTEMGALDQKTISPARLRDLFALFAGLLDSWNVTRKGEPVPATYEGVVSQSPGFVMEVIGALSKAVAGVDPTSPPGSNAGGPSEASIPMTPLSPGS